MGLEDNLRDLYGQEKKFGEKNYPSMFIRNSFLASVMLFRSGSCTIYPFSLEGLMLKLKLQYFGRLMQRTGSLEKTLMLGKIEGRRRRGRQRVRWLDGIADTTDMGLDGLRQLMDREAWRAVVHGVAKSQTRLSG